MALRLFGRVFRPQLWPTIFVTGAFVVLVGLGGWQVQRMHWKHDLVTRIAAQMQAAPGELRLPPTEDIRALEYRRASVAGIFLHDKEIFLAARDLEGHIGYQVITPLQTPDNHFVLVNRGWIPLDKKDSQTRAEGQVVGPVTVTGVIRLPRPRSWFQADNRPGENFWFWIDLPAIAAVTGVTGLQPILLEADATPNPGSLPVGGQTRVNFPDNHFVYAMTWFLLALGLLVMYFHAHLKREK